MVHSFDTTIGTVRVYDYFMRGRKAVVTQQCFYRARLVFDGKRCDGSVSRTIRLAVETLFAKLKVGTSTQKTIFAKCRFPVSVHHRTAMSQRSRVKKLLQVSKHRVPPVHVFRLNNSRAAAISYVARLRDNKIRMQLMLPCTKRLYSNWHATAQDAYVFLANKAKSQQHGDIRLETPAIFREGANRSGVKVVHQMYGLFRDGAPMSTLFQSSSESWRQYCLRQTFCRYILWNADQLDSLVRKYAPPWLLALYIDVRYLVQRCDIGRFFVLFLYGGLYADLDVFPNRDTFPEVELGFCKMASRKIFKRPEWEIEIVVATRGNQWLLALLWHMCVATEDKNAKKGYHLMKPCRYIYNTTGPTSVFNFFARSEYEPSIVFFSMCRPVSDLQSQVVLDATGRIGGYQPTLSRYDVLSAFSMSYQGMPAVSNSPLSFLDVDLPLFPVTVNRRLRDNILGFVELPQAMQVRGEALPTIDSDIREAEVKSDLECDSSRRWRMARSDMVAHADMLFVLGQSTSNVTFNLLETATQDYIRSFA